MHDQESWPRSGDPGFVTKSVAAHAALYFHWTATRGLHPGLKAQPPLRGSALLRNALIGFTLPAEREVLSVEQGRHMRQQLQWRTATVKRQQASAFHLSSADVTG